MDKELTHDRMHEHGIVHSHTHSHTHKETKAVLNRMSKIIGHMESVKTMVENGRDCSEVLIQLAAVKSAISSVSRVILKDHIDHCIVEAVKENDTESIEELKNAIDKFL
ncbi:MAG: metal-sensing transcriptional repressor [Lachnospiraceae bacterium]|jgi:DNA-binding FrmR family transcriptional regulator|nr:metal-sensing transcriptional repressor [Lachnospiraceae bacterium]MCI8967200.1 metal-sensing transcriptional repressor [Lachnospiraceae bacterium]MDE6920314.1 metal-sensing transcriptional repressor [Lachnospiraceae bacterium]MDE6940732.1 metal-sensing transcriptional repressor [Lachnospiraceae bacterium]